jgi:hypothetical protein
MLSGPPGMQNEQVSGTEVSKKCFCVGLASSGTMKPWMRCTVFVQALLRALNTGSTAVLVVFLVRSVSTDQGTTSLRTGSGAIGLLGLW